MKPGSSLGASVLNLATIAARTAAGGEKAAGAAGVAGAADADAASTDGADDKREGLRSGR